MTFSRSGGAAALLALLVAAAPGASLAVPLTVANHSFESPATGPGTFITNAAPPGWSTYGSINFFGSRVIGVVNPHQTTLYADPVPDDQNVGVTFFLPSFTNVEAGMQQTLADTLQTQTTYTLRVAVGNMAVDSNPPHNAFNFNGFPGYRVDLLAGTTVIASDNNTLLPGEGRFLTSTVQVTTGASHPNAGQALRIRLVNLDAAPGIEVNFDNVRLDADPVPTATPTPTHTLPPTNTPTEIPTDTPAPTDTPTDTPLPTATPTDTPLPTETPTGTPAPTDTPTESPVPTYSPTHTATPTPTAAPGLCPATPPPHCKTPVPQRGSLQLRANLSSAARNSALWSWKGQATTLDELGAPLVTTGYRFCLYDGGGAVVLNIAAPAAANCGAKPCWRALKSGFRYRDTSGTSSGLVGLSVAAGGDGRASIRLKAKGASLSLPALPLAIAPDPAQVVLLNEESGACWTAQFSTVLTDAVSLEKWKARND